MSPRSKTPVPPRLADDEVAELLRQGVDPVSLCGIFNVRIDQVMRVRNERGIFYTPPPEDLPTRVQRVIDMALTTMVETFHQASPDVRLRTAAGLTSRVFAALGGSGNDDLLAMRQEFERFVIDAEVIDDADEVAQED